MYNKAIELINIFNDNGYESYIVGGFVRDKLIGKESNDIDICTSATPKEIMELFDIATSTENQYGAVTVIYKNYKYDVTTFRREIKYEGNRKPVKIKYIKNFKKDLLRRDFTINTLCIDKDEKIIDLLNVRKDLDNKLIKTVGNPRYRIHEDSLRILRAIRFSATLDFDIEVKTKHFLTKYSYLLKTLSYQRKKDELNKIFLSLNKEKGRELLVNLKLCKDLDIPKLKDIDLCDDLIGIWAQLEVDDIYPFTKLEKEQMSEIRALMKENIYDAYTIYKYGLYVTTVVADIKNIDRKKINNIYSKLPILSSKDIKIKPIEISKILNRNPGSYLKDIMKDIEKEIVRNNLDNDYEKIKEYIIKKY